MRPNQPFGFSNPQQPQDQRNATFGNGGQPQGQGTPPITNFFARQQQQQQPQQQQQQQQQQQPQQQQQQQQPRQQSSFQLSMEQVMNGRHGMQASQQQRQENLSRSQFADRWRTEAQDQGHGGHGQDELVRTSFAVSTLMQGDEQMSEPQQDRQAFKMSMLRQDVANASWPKDDQTMGFHPGAARTDEQLQRGKGTWNKGHTSRDRSRIAGVDAEPRTSNGGVSFDMLARAEVETVNTMNTSYEELMDRRGELSRDLTHAVHGDLRNDQNYERMAQDSQANREGNKWDAAGLLMANQDTREHVPEVMQEYIREAGGNHRQAAVNFQSRVHSGEETRVNTEPRSQAQPLQSNETLRQTGREVRQGTRARALSAPRFVPNRNIY